MSEYAKGNWRISPTVFEVLDRSPELLYFFEHPATYEIDGSMWNLLFQRNLKWKTLIQTAFLFRKGKRITQ
jgi:hypothetical protein